MKGKKNSLLKRVINEEENIDFQKFVFVNKAIC